MWYAEIHNSKRVPRRGTFRMAARHRDRGWGAGPFCLPAGRQIHPQPSSPAGRLKPGSATLDSRRGGKPRSPGGNRVRLDRQKRPRLRSRIQQHIRQQPAPTQRAPNPSWFPKSSRDATSRAGTQKPVRLLSFLSSDRPISSRVLKDFQPASARGHSCPQQRPNSPRLRKRLWSANRFTLLQTRMSNATRIWGSA